MSIIDLQESLKDVSDDGLMEAFRSGSAPQFLVLGELQRRKRMRDDFKRREAADMPTVAEEMITGAGVPQEGLMAMAGAMAPNTALSQDTGIDQVMPMQATRAPQPQMAASGGLMSFASGGAISVQPTGGGNYILVQDGERVQGTGIYPDFSSADAASRAIRDAQPFQVPRILADEGLAPSPTAMDEGPSLQEINPDSTAFVAPEVVSEPSLNMDTAGGLGRMFFDERIPKVPSDQPSLEEQLADRLGFAVDADKLARLSEIDTPPPSVLAAQAGVDSTQVASDAPDRSIDRQINPEKYMDLDDFLAQDSMRDRSSDRGSSLKYPTFLPYPTASGSFGNDAELAMGYGLEDSRRGRNRPRTERTSDILNSFYPELPIPASDVEAPVTIASEARKSAEEALQKQEDSFTQPDTVTDGGEDGMGFGSPESEISKLLADRRKRADQNKWLALAEAGFAMMGPAATFGQGIAKGGQAGLKALRESQKGLDAFETDMLKLQASMDIADARNQATLDAAKIRSDATVDAALARLKGSAKNAPVGLVTAAASQVDDARRALDFARTDPEKLAAQEALDRAQARFEAIFNSVGSQYPDIAAALSGLGSASSNRKQI